MVGGDKIDNYILCIIGISNFFSVFLFLKKYFQEGLSVSFFKCLQISKEICLQQTHSVHSCVAQELTLVYLRRLYLGPIISLGPLQKEEEAGQNTNNKLLWYARNCCRCLNCMNSLNPANDSFAPVLQKQRQLTKVKGIFSSSQLALGCRNLALAQLVVWDYCPQTQPCLSGSRTTREQAAPT